MSTLIPGPAIPVCELSSLERDELRAELVWLEEDLLRRRSKLRYWSHRKYQAETLDHIPEDMRESAFFFYEQALNLVTTGERLRSYLLLQLKGQPEYAPAYHRAH